MDQFQGLNQLLLGNPGRFGQHPADSADFRVLPKRTDQEHDHAPSGFNHDQGVFAISQDEFADPPTFFGL